MSGNLDPDSSAPDNAGRSSHSPLSHEYVPSPESATPPVSHIPPHRDSFANRSPHRSRDLHRPMSSSAASSAENLDVESSILSLIGTLRNMDATLVRDVLPEVYLVLAGSLLRGGELTQAKGTCEVAVEMATKRVDAHKSRGRSGGAMHAVGVRNDAERLMLEIETVSTGQKKIGEITGPYSPGVKVANSREGSPAADRARRTKKDESRVVVSDMVKQRTKEFGIIFNDQGKVELEGIADDLTKDKCLYDKVKEALEDGLNNDDVDRVSALLSDPRIRSAKFYFTPSKQTPLLIASSRGSSAMASLLLSLGADPNEEACSSITPLQIAAYHCARTNTCDNLSVAELLISHGADVKQPNDATGNTPLHSASAFGCDSFAKLLVEKGAFVDAKNNIGNTPLHEAAEWGLEKMVKFLLEAGADVNAKNEAGETALDLSKKGTCGGSNNDVADILKQWAEEKGRSEGM